METENMKVERKFIVDRSQLPKIKRMATNIVKIEQYYTCAGDLEERYCRFGDKFFHTVRAKIYGGLTRMGFEEECSSSDYESNKIDMIGNIISKARYFIQSPDYVCKIDEYLGQMKGLNICSLEFASEQEAEIIDVPEFCKEEVTTNSIYRSKNLALNGLPMEHKRI